MRIISQDGAFDVPYENADLERKGTIISVWTLDNVYYNGGIFHQRESD